MKHKHTVVNKFWSFAGVGKPYYWCSDPGCGVAAVVTKDTADVDPQVLLDRAVKALTT